MLGGPSVVFTRKAVVDETFIRKASSLCKSFVCIDASHLYPHSMCQPMPTRLYTRWEYDSETKRLAARQTKSRSFENMVRVAQIAKMIVMSVLIDKRKMIASR